MFNSSDQQPCEVSLKQLEFTPYCLHLSLLYTCSPWCAPVSVSTVKHGGSHSAISCCFCLTG
uniref:Uncharacterized protein n=1 Tax=Anguilla anguilla TaxID=7936 RepID=A0A0E9SWJ2_ANGAN